MYFYLVYLSPQRFIKYTLHEKCSKNALKKYADKLIIKDVEIIQPRARCEYCKKILNEKLAAKWEKEFANKKPLRQLSSFKIKKFRKNYSLFQNDELLLTDVSFSDLKNHIYDTLKPSKSIMSEFNDLFFVKLNAAK